MKNVLGVVLLCVCATAWAGVYKCTDASGRHVYRSSPCTEEHQAIRMNPKTGSSVDVTSQEKQLIEQGEQQKRELLEQQEREKSALQAIELRRQQARAEYEQTQQWMRSHPEQFSAYAVPVYDPEHLPASVKLYEDRLVDIERLRRLAAQKALADGTCQRVEADELSSKTTENELVIMINCSSGTTYHLNEVELSQ